MSKGIHLLLSAPDATNTMAPVPSEKKKVQNGRGRKRNSKNSNSLKSPTTTDIHSSPKSRPMKRAKEETGMKKEIDSSLTTEEEMVMGVMDSDQLTSPLITGSIHGDLAPSHALFGSVLPWIETQVANPEPSSMLICRELGRLQVLSLMRSCLPL